MQPRAGQRSPSLHAHHSQFDQPEFEEQGPPGRDPAARRREAAAAGGGPKRSRAPDHILKAGQPLPSFGTCRHYCHSYRLGAEGGQNWRFWPVTRVADLLLYLF